jgi:hypothetical protein
MKTHFLTLAGVLITLTVQADDIPSSGGQLGLGDRVVLSVDIPGFERVDDTSARPAQHVAPQGSVLWIDSKPDLRQRVTVHFSCIAKTATKTRLWCSRSSTSELQKHAEAATTAGYAGVVNTHTQYRIPLDSLKLYAVSSVGSQYGVLLVPYKFHLSDRSFSSGVTLGGYYSYALSSPGISWGPVASAGLAVVPVATTTESGEPTTENKAAVSAAVGLLVTFSKTNNFQIGLLAGWDWLGSDAEYEHEGKTWVAISFGVPLTK